MEVNEATYCIGRVADRATNRSPWEIYLKMHSNIILSTQKYKNSTLAETHDWWALKIALIVLI